jgi:LacI family transcriptional regulator
MLRKRVTLRELARELGLSERSVSQALNPRASNVQLSAKTTELICELAEKRGYQPDTSARSMRYGRFFNIGYFEAKNTPVSWSMLGAEAGVFDEAIDHNYRVVLVRLPQNANDESADVPSIFKEANLDALILCHAGNLPKKFEEIIDASGFPIIYLNEKKRYNAVYVNDLDGAEEITTHLICEGRQRIAYLSVSSGELHYSISDRKLGYLNAMKNAGLAPMLLDYHDWIEWEEPFRRWFEANIDQIDAIVCSNDYWAVQALRVLYRYHDAFPGKIAITGFDDIAKDISPLRLTTMSIPFYEMGRSAVRMALTLVNENKSRLPSCIVRPELVIRDSTKKTE